MGTQAIRGVCSTRGANAVRFGRGEHEVVKHAELGSHYSPGSEREREGYGSKLL